MMPRIRRTKDWETKFGKWMTYNSRHGDITNSLFAAVQYWFWYMGVNPRIAFFQYGLKRPVKKDTQ